MSKKITEKQLAANRKNGKKGGRPATEIDWEQFDKLCEIHATLIEIAGWFRCDTDTIERIVKKEQGMGFRDYYALKSGNGKISLRRAQWRKALDGDNTMMIWLGKQHLGQTDKSRIDQNVKSENIVIYLPDNGRGYSE